MNKHALTLAATVVLGSTLWQSAAVALTIDTSAPWSALGQPNWSPDGGNPGRAGGLAWTASFSDLNLFDVLVYSLGDYENGSFVVTGPSLSIDSSPSTNNLAFSGPNSDLSNGVVVWRGNESITWHNGTAFQTSAIQTQFTLSVEDTTGNSISLVSPEDFNLPTALGGVFEVTGDFRVNYLFEIQNPSSGYTFGPSLTVFDALDTQPGQSLYSSVTSGLYYEEASNVDAPSAPLLMGIGGLMLWRLRRTRRLA